MRKTKKRRNQTTEECVNDNVGSGKHKKKAKRKAGVIILEILYLITLVAAAVMIFRLNVLPTKYLIACAVVAVGITVGVFALCHSSKSGKIKAGIIITILFILIYGVGCAYLIHTLGFFSNITGGNEAQQYYVLTPKNSTATDVSDLKGKDVHIIANASKVDETAMEHLDKDVSVNYVDDGNYLDIGKGLLSGKYDAAMISSPYMEMIDESSDCDGFKESVNTVKTISVPLEKKDISKNVNVTKDCFIVYVSGLDTEGKVSNLSRSDVNMIAVVNPTEKKVMLVSIPRDYYVKLHSYGAMDKLTHTGIHGINETIQTVEDLYDIKINYYAKVNFTSVRSLVDAIGGIDVESEYAFTTVKGGYFISQGTNHMNGDKALSFARERKHVPGGDNQRVKDQQAVMSSVIDKVSNSKTILTNYNKLLSAMEDKVDTNMSEKEMTSLIKMQLDDMSEWDISTISANGTGEHGSCYSNDGLYSYVMRPSEDSVAEVKTAIDQASINSDVDKEEDAKADMNFFQRIWIDIKCFFSGLFN